MSQYRSILTTLLRPAVLFALRRGVKLRDLLDILKDLMLREAHAHLEAAGEKPSVSRLAVMTGLQRRDVTRVQQAPPDASRQLNLVTKVIGTWCHHPEFSKNGEPLPLSFEGLQSEFPRLVNSVSLDVSPYTLRFELERLGIVSREGSTLVLRRRSYDVGSEADQGFLLLGSDIENLTSAVYSNVNRATGIPNLHITTRYDNIAAGRLAEIRQWILKRGADFHAELRNYLSSQDCDLNPTLYAEKGGGQVTVTSFSVAAEPPAQELPKIEGE